MPIETVIVNNYGDTAQKFSPNLDWRNEYQRYLDAYEKADDKAKFNAEWFSK